MRKIPEGKSPEEKLLKIIEGPQAGGGSEGKRRTFKLRLRDFKFPQFNIKKVKMKSLNLGMLTLAFILTIIFITIFVRKKNAFSERVGFLVAKNKKPSAIFFESKEKKPSFEKYMLEIEKNNPFDLIPESAVSKKQEVKVSFKLVGIIWSDKPQAIIEEEISKKTYTLSKGDSLVGGYKVIKISSEGVVIRGKHGEEVLR